MYPFLTRVSVITLLTLSLTVGMTASQAQLVNTDPDWKATEVPAPPALNATDLKRLIPFEVSASSALRWAIDPVSIKITDDGLVRYVVVARSPTGLINALYETINCNKAEFKTHARYNANSGWSTTEHPQWRSMYDKMPSKHALILAKLGACVGNASAQSATDMVQALKKTGTSAIEP